MASLNSKAHSSTKRQHQTLVIAGQDRGFDLAEIRKMVGGSICKLSALECSNWIERFTGRGLSNPPGQKPKTYTGRPAAGTVRMITADQIDQIVRLGLAYFGQPRRRSPFGDWLCKNFREVPHVEPLDRDNLAYMVRSFATHKRAGEIIHVLKEMHARRDRGEAHQAASTTGGSPWTAR